MDQYWATYTIYTHYGVSRVVGGVPSANAYCDLQSGTGCDDAESGWQTVGATGSKNFPALTGFADKLDVENILLDDAGKAWFTPCLTKPGFPQVTN